MTRKHTLTETPERLPNVTASKKYTVQHRDKFGFANVSVVPTTGDLSTDDPAFVLPGGRNIVLHVGSSETLAASGPQRIREYLQLTVGVQGGYGFPLYRPPRAPVWPCVCRFARSGGLRIRLRTGASGPALEAHFRWKWWDRVVAYNPG